MLTEEDKQLMKDTVDRGIKFLNKDFPDWKTKINPDVLNIQSLDNCIIGQLRVAYFGDRWNSGNKLCYTTALGFDISYDVRVKGETENAYDYLALLWLKELGEE